MAAGSVSGSKSVQKIYTFGGTHYQQVQSAPVSPVSSVKKLLGVEKQEERRDIAVTYQQDGTEGIQSGLQASFANKMAAEYEQLDNISYDMSNPYEASRKTAEESLLAGLHFDKFA